MNEDFVDLIREALVFAAELIDLPTKQLMPITPRLKQGFIPSFMATAQAANA